VLLDPEHPQVFLRDGRVVLHFPIRLRQRGGKKEVLVPQGIDGGADAADRKPSALAVTLARGLRWAEFLEQGRYPTVAALAGALNLDRSYVAKVLNLTLLAPDLVVAILAGREPAGLSLARLRGEWPSAWAEQRRLFDNKA
jgi:hypothetical protein